MSERQHSLETSQHASTHIRKLRIKLGLSQDQLAQRAGVSQSTISKFESGATGAMFFEEYFRVLRALEVECKFFKKSYKVSRPAMMATA
jgi:transcriptional regulator with XRE-family HTH domain